MFSVINNEHDKLLVEDLYSRHKYTLYYIANNILHDKPLAEDAVHNTFVRIIAHLHKIENRSEKQKLSFLCVVCRRISIDMYNKNKKAFENEFSDDDIGERESDIMENPLDLYISAETLTGLKNEIKGLSDTYRDVMNLKYIMDFSNEDISKLLNISQATLRKRLERGKNLLRKSMKGAEFNESK